MFWARTTKSIGSVVLVLLLAAPVWAGSAVLQKGDPAPFDGLLLDEAATSQAVQDITTPVQEIEKLKQDAGVCDLQIKTLAAALDLAEKRDQARAVIEDEMAKALAMNERAFALSERAAKLALDAAEKSNAALDKAEERIHAANKRGFWGALLGALGGFFGALVLHGVP